MFTLKIYWEQEDFPKYTVYSASKYLVVPIKVGQIRLHLENSSEQDREINVTTGAKVFVMNSHGATVDTIIP